MENVYKTNDPLIKMNSITKDFSGVRALSNVTIDVYKGEIHSICGENGAGKSTLMKILSGAYIPDSGTIVIGNQTFSSLTPQISQKAGINIIYQENLLVPTMNIVENIFVGQKTASRFGFVNFKSMLKKTNEVMDYFGIYLDPYRKIERLSIAEQQFVKILKALITEPKLLIMDEPTSMFNIEDANYVLNLVGRISEKGIGIIYISHFLKEIVKIADRITVIRDGHVVNSYFNQEKNMDLNIITKDMVGRSVDMFYVKQSNEIGENVLEVNQLKLNKYSPEVTFSLKKGEILGIAGMVGSGRTEIIRALSGADLYYSGKVIYKGKRIKMKTPRDAIKAGIAHITEDRQNLGLMLQQSIVENTTIVGLDKIIKGFFVNVLRHASLIEPIVQQLNIKAPSLFKEVKYLSGGNQQKVVLGKWLFVQADIFIFDEPTRGVDVNSKTEFYKIMSSLTKKGKSIIMVSSDMTELISMSDRILVIRNEKITNELGGHEISEEAIIKNALEVTK